jgi:hypothetical protein
MLTYKIKPLDWEQPSGGYCKTQGSGINSLMLYSQYGEGWSFNGKKYETIEQAKEAAWDHYVEKVESLLIKEWKESV